MPKRFVRTRLARAISYSSIPVIGLMSHQGLAQDQPIFEQIIVTGSRREANVQEIPLNITAVGGDQIEDLRLDGISKMAFYVPGLTVVDRGPRDEEPDVLVRGLNTTGLGPGFISDAVASYLGEIPLQVDVNPVDLERVEVLIGPQGTLYGQGTMGGAIRYIPRLANSQDGFTASVRGNSYSGSESDDLGYEYGATLNIPLIENVLAVRLNADKRDDPGFIDYNYVVQTSGVSNPQPDFNDPSDVAANLRQVEDANGEETTSYRVNLRWTPLDWLDANFWYYDQETDAEGRQINNRLSFGTDRYTSGLRYEEPNKYSNELISFEGKVDLGFAEATLVYGETEYDEDGQRDQTDLLLDFQLGYELFPSFSAYTKEIVNKKTETLEARLVSKYPSKFSWVLGYFDNEGDRKSSSEEFTPGFDQFAIDNFGGIQLRPDNLEYIELINQFKKETAFYGELAYEITDDLIATVGYRAYEFETDTEGGFATPLLDTVFFGDPQDAINIDLGTNEGKDDGDLWKFNLAWTYSLDDLVYFTYSQGYRNGGINAVPVCTQEDIDSGVQVLCILDDEVFIEPDTIDNYEIGYKGLLTDNISIAAAIYFIDWEDLQVATVSEFGNLQIIGNGSAAESKGFEFQGQWLVNTNWTVAATYAYTNAELTARAPGLVGPFDALSGARLPGHAEHQGSVNVTYDTTVFNGWDLTLNYGVVYSSDVFNTVGGDEDPLVLADDNSPGDWGGEAIPSYDIHHLSATMRRDNWTIQAYVDNLWDEYYITGTRSTRRDLMDERAGPGVDIAGFTLRSYLQYVGAPRNIGIRLVYDF